MRMLIPRRPWNDRFVSNDWSSFLNEMDRVFEGFMSPTPGFESTAAVRPACEVNESEENYLVEVDLPGVRKEDIKIEAKDGRLMIQGERRREVESENGKGYVERYYGRFERVFSLPENVNADHIEAHYADGVLRLVLPKTRKSVGRAIEVQTGKEGIFGKLLGKAKPESKSVDSH